MAFKIPNRVRMSITGTPGTGDVSLNVATSGYQTLTNGGVANGDTFSYVIEDGANWEVGLGTYNSSGPSFARTTVRASSGGGTSKISASSSAVVYGSILGEDVAAPSAPALVGLSDVNITTGSGEDGKVVYWDNTAGEFQLKTVSGGGGSGLTPPNPASLTDVTSLNGVTPVYQTTGGVPAMVVNAGSGVSDGVMLGMFEAVPSGSWSAICKAKASAWPPDGPNWKGCGIGVLNTTNHKGMSLQRAIAGYQYIMNYTTTELTGGGVNVGGYVMNNADEFQHIDYDGTNIKFGLSQDGVNVLWIHSEVATSSPLGAAPTHIGPEWGGGYSSTAGPNFYFLHYHIGALGTNGL